MKNFVSLVESRLHQSARTNPWLLHLQDEQATPLKRLTGWLPCGAPFIMGFKDFNNVTLRYPDDEASRDPLKQAINAHADEDGKHWAWYIGDLKKLGWDTEMKVTDMFRFLWGKDTVHQRKGIYALTVLAHENTDPVMRYCLIQAIEVAVTYIWGLFAKLAVTHEKETGRRLVYVGEIHHRREVGQVLVTASDGSVLSTHHDDHDVLFGAIRLDEAQRNKAVEIMNLVYETLEAVWTEVYQYTMQSNDTGKRSVFRV